MLAAVISSEAEGITGGCGGGATTIVLSGSHTIGTVNDVKADLIEAIRSSTESVVDLAKVEDADLSLIQLLLAAQKTATKMGKIFRIFGKPSETLVRALAVGGFIEAGSPKIGPAVRNPLWSRQEEV